MIKRFKRLVLVLVFACWGGASFADNYDVWINEVRTFIGQGNYDAAVGAIEYSLKLLNQFSARLDGAQRLTEDQVKQLIGHEKMALPTNMQELMLKALNTKKLSEGQRVGSLRALLNKAIQDRTMVLEGVQARQKEVLVKTVQQIKILETILKQLDTLHAKKTYEQYISRVGLTRREQTDALDALNSGDIVRARGLLLRAIEARRAQLPLVEGSAQAPASSPSGKEPAVSSVNQKYQVLSKLGTELQALAKKLEMVRGEQWDQEVEHFVTEGEQLELEVSRLQTETAGGKPDAAVVSLLLEAIGARQEAISNYKEAIAIYERRAAKLAQLKQQVAAAKADAVKAEDAIGPLVEEYESAREGKLGNDEVQRYLVNAQQAEDDAFGYMAQALNAAKVSNEDSLREVIRLYTEASRLYKESAGWFKQVIVLYRKQPVKPTPVSTSSSSASAPYSRPVVDTSKPPLALTQKDVDAQQVQAGNEADELARVKQEYERAKAGKAFNAQAQGYVDSAEDSARYASDIMSEEKMDLKTAYAAYKSASHYYKEAAVEYRKAIAAYQKPPSTSSSSSGRPPYSRPVVDTSSSASAKSSIAQEWNDRLGSTIRNELMQLKQSSKHPNPWEYWESQKNPLIRTYQDLTNTVLNPIQQKEVEAATFVIWNDVMTSAPAPTTPSSSASTSGAAQVKSPLVNPTDKQAFSFSLSLFDDVLKRFLYAGGETYRQFKQDLKFQDQKDFTKLPSGAELKQWGKDIGLLLPNGELREAQSKENVMLMFNYINKQWVAHYEPYQKFLQSLVVLYHSQIESELR
jgi:hypothetical protein